MTAGREQDARETLREAIERLCDEADARESLRGIVHTAQLRAALAAPSPPATDGDTAGGGES